ncbi:MAG: hypothetical protein AUK55_04695 [Syntrophobacteraceae bacterium CG2_30_61_12]|nr:MAG: hypothetical protein AUK55_04695 [Syntrophobacteraceae bacterium CG2_30_61_12]PIU31696.1 MAG: hypothetical protein COT06_06740 [Syntrophobacteraceae bacterium CG07_land_8_20_14_0_80_61_8]
MGADNEAKVAITGIGMITPLGVNARSTWAALLAGRSGVGPITKFDAAGCRTRIGGELPAAYLELEKKHTTKRVEKMTVRATRMIRICALEAIADSGLDSERIDQDRVAVIIGTSGSSVRSPIDRETPRTAKFRIIREMVNAMPAWISLDHGFKGPSYTVSAGSCSSAVAVSQAYDLIRSGAVDRAVTGGADYLLTENNVKRWNSRDLLSTRNDNPEQAVRPFDRSRDGYVLADGSCALMLESAISAKARGAHIYAWLVAAATRSDDGCSVESAREGVGLAATLELAIRQCGLPKTAIGYVSANGSAVVREDLHETRALKQVFGDHARKLLVSSQKSMLGHSIGASGAIELAVTALALESGKFPPTINYHEPDPECDLNFVSNSMVEAPSITAALSLTFARGGHSNVMVLARAR